MHTSLIICTRNRAGQLRQTLRALLGLAWVPDSLEVILVDTDSADDTKDVMAAFVAEAPWRVRILNTSRRGISVARNSGIVAADGDLIVCVDDDCLIDPQYFLHLIPAVQSGRFAYGAGGVVLHNPLDAAIAVSSFRQETIIQPRSIIPPGLVHGANLFFLRGVFEKAGMFNEYMSGGSRLAEDVEMATRASMSGFTGVLFPAAFVRHHHQRRPNSPELAEMIVHYERSGGAYYAALLSDGHADALKLWADRVGVLRGNLSQRRLNERLQREFQSAAEFLACWLADTEEDRSAKRPVLPPRVETCP
jgi:glycosyltransferase involved in cell wall biosynthesis